jgi:hypothetical protein
MAEPDLLDAYITRELRRSSASWLKWVLASALTLVGSSLGAGWTAGKYLEEIRAGVAHAEYVAEQAAACCIRQSDRMDNLK